MTVTVKWKDPNAFEEGKKIYRSPTYFTKDNLPAQLVDLGPDVEEYEDTTANAGENWYMIRVYMTNGHELFSQAFIPEGKT